MSGDYSRIDFDPTHDYLGVLLQQGRPLTDADWNALVLQLRRRIHVETIDTFGIATVPAHTSDGFKIVSNGTGGLAILPGRLYVGLLAENHGDEPLIWDPHLEELIGTGPIDYTEQPYYPNPDPLPDTAGPHLAYLDVWQREGTHLTHAGLVEKAVGVDTCTRLQTVWQVKLLADVEGVNCDTPLEQVPGWLPAHAPSAGRLSTLTVPVPGEPDPCLIPLLSGYKGRENQCYRLQVQVGGALGVATFKWSRDNGSVGALVTHIPSLNTVVVDSVGRDSVLRFNVGDVVEVIDKWRELRNLPGELRRIQAVDDPTRTITLETELPPDLFPTEPTTGATEPERHTRIQRWDQSGVIRDENGNELENLDDPGSTGAITVPAGDIGVLLEHNIVARFSMATPGGELHSGDYWNWEARSIDGSIKELVEAPPLGIHHHYAKLALVTLPADIIDCRHVCDPCEGGAPQQPTPGARESCACTVCVTPTQHNSGQLTIQAAINQVVQAAKGGTVCLVAGEYHLDQPLNIASPTSLRLVGQGVSTVLESAGAILVIQGSTNVVLEAFTMLSRAGAGAPGAALSIRSSQDISVERIVVRFHNQNTTTWSSVGLIGDLSGIRFTSNMLSGFVGISAGPATTHLTDLRIVDNTCDCRSVAVQLAGSGVHHHETIRLRGNRVMTCEQAGFVLTGTSELRSAVEIAGNVLRVKGSGIEAGLDRMRVVENDIEATEPVPGDHVGVNLLSIAENQNGPESIQIVNNRIVDFRRAAIRCAEVQGLHAVEIKANQIEAGGTGVDLNVSGVADQLVIENNQVSMVRGIGILAEARQARVLTSGNQIETEGGHAPARLVFEQGESVFTDNICRRREGVADTPDVVLGAHTLIVTSNRIQGSDGTSLQLLAERRHYTVLGNIARGAITVSSGIEPQWVPLNVQNVQN